MAEVLELVQEAVTQPLERLGVEELGEVLGVEPQVEPVKAHLVRIVEHALLVPVVLLPKHEMRAVEELDDRPDVVVALLLDQVGSRAHVLLSPELSISVGDYPEPGHSTSSARVASLLVDTGAGRRSAGRRSSFHHRARSLPQVMGTEA